MQTVTGLVIETVGNELIFTVVVAEAFPQPFTVAVTVKMPSSFKLTLVRVGFCEDALKLLGPDQTYVAPVIFDALKFKTPPSHTGELLLTVGEEGIGLTVTVVLTVALEHVFELTTKVYIPE